MTGFDPVAWAQRRLDVTRDDRMRVQHMIGQQGVASAQYVSARAAELVALDAIDGELTMFLRVAHGMNPNGRWPHPPGTCVQCGSATDAPDEPLCTGYACTKRRTETPT